MTAEQLEELLGKVTQGEWRVLVDESAAQVTGYPCIEADNYTVVGLEGMYGDIDVDFANATLIALAPSLARKVIAAEKLVERLDEILYDSLAPLHSVHEALTAYREASK